MKQFGYCKRMPVVGKINTAIIAAALYPYDIVQVQPVMAFAGSQAHIVHDAIV